MTPVCSHRCGASWRAKRVMNRRCVTCSSALAALAALVRLMAMVLAEEIILPLLPLEVPDEADLEKAHAVLVSSVA